MMLAMPSPRSVAAVVLRVRHGTAKRFSFVGGARRSVYAATALPARRHAKMPAAPRQRSPIIYAARLSAQAVCSVCCVLASMPRCETPNRLARAAVDDRDTPDEMPMLLRTGVGAYAFSDTLRYVSCARCAVCAAQRKSARRCFACARFMLRRFMRQCALRICHICCVMLPRDVFESILSPQRVFRPPYFIRRDNYAASSLPPLSADIHAAYASIAA